MPRASITRVPKTGRAPIPATSARWNSKPASRRSVRDELTRRGHKISAGDGGYGGYQAILRDPQTGVYWGASEMRKDGAAMGY